MNKEEIEIKEFDKEQLEILLNDLQDIDKFTGFKDGAFKYELGKYQANLLVGCIEKYKKVIFTIKNIISKRIKEYQQKIDNEIDMGSQGDYFKICRYEEQVKFLKDILKEVE